MLYFFKHQNVNIIFICNFRNDGKDLGKKLVSIGELLTYHGMVLESKIIDAFKVMDEEAGKLVTDFSALDGQVREGKQEYEHQN